jgi:hypothetical protein
VLKAKNGMDADRAKATQKGTMKWLGFMSSFVLERIFSLSKPV